MKETIEYYYNLSIDKLDEKDGRYYFRVNNRDYIFVFFNRTKEELRDIFNVLQEMIQKGIKPNMMIFNIKKELLTIVNGYSYVLLECSNGLEKFDIFDMLSVSKQLMLNNSSSLLYRNNWDELWSKKIDYIEYQLKELAINKTVIKNSASYYIGLSEVAISYVVNTKRKFGRPQYRLALAHRRIFYPNYRLNYMNPLSFIFDMDIRDIAEYLKAMFFKEDMEEVLEELVGFLKVRHLNDYEAQMFLSRLIYPTYYWDLYENVMNKMDDEEKLVQVIAKSRDMENFLKKAYLEISKYAQIEKIDWLIN